MAAVTQQALWNVMKDYSESKKQQVLNFALSLGESEGSPTGDDFLTKIDRGIAQKNAGELQYHDLIED